MQFNKSRVYTALNADELEVGSMVIVADNLKDLKAKVLDGYEDMQHRLIKIGEERFQNRFFTTENLAWALAYLVSPPESKKTPKYKPFSNSETAYKIIAAHGGWIKQGRVYHFVTGLDIGCRNGDQIQLDRSWFSAKFVCEKFTFADNGSLVGQRIEDSDTEEDGGNE